MALPRNFLGVLCSSLLEAILNAVLAAVLYLSDKNWLISYCCLVSICWSSTRFNCISNLTC